MPSLEGMIGSAEWNLKRILRRIVPMRLRRVGKDGVSIFLLLRSPHLFGEYELRLAAERAWGVSFACGEGSTRAVFESEQGTVLQAGSHLLRVFNYSRPYSENPSEDVSWLPMLSQQRAWAEHTACACVQYVNARTDVEMAHCVLAKLVAQLLNENCTGIYVPSENSLISADESLYEELQKMGSFRASNIVSATEIVGEVKIPHSTLWSSLTVSHGFKTILPNIWLLSMCSWAARISFRGNVRSTTDFNRPAKMCASTS